MSDAYVPAAFDPDTLRLIEDAIADARDTLRQLRGDRALDDETNLTLIRRIVARAAKGERNVNRLTIYAINGHAQTAPAARCGPSRRDGTAADSPPSMSSNMIF